MKSFREVDIVFRYTNNHISPVQLNCLAVSIWEDSSTSRGSKSEALQKPIESETLLEHGVCSKTKPYDCERKWDAKKNSIQTATQSNKASLTRDRQKQSWRKKFRCCSMLRRHCCWESPVSWCESGIMLLLKLLAATVNSLLKNQRRGFWTYHCNTTHGDIIASFPDD